MLLGASWLCTSKGPQKPSKGEEEERGGRREGADMDESSLLDLLECSVCLERLDTTARVLPCQHTFCRRCLQSIVSSRNELRCPECRILVECGVDDLPANILLVRLLDGIRQRPRNSPTGSPTAGGHHCAGSNNSNNHSPGCSATGGTAGTPCTPNLRELAAASQNALLLAKEEHLELKELHCRKAVKRLVWKNISQLPCGKALYAYEGKEPGDLKFNKGDIIILRRKVDENWYHGELNGNRGFFPASYIQCIKPLSQPPPQGKALYDFEIKDKDQDKDCLTFTKDEILTVIRRVDDNWAEGMLGDKIGIFPILYVEDSSSFGSTAGAGAASPKTGTLIGEQGSSPKVQLPLNVYLALYAYKPQKNDELELRKGEMYRVTEKCQDGWFKGTSLRNGASGVFPGNYVTPVSRMPAGFAQSRNCTMGVPLASRSSPLASHASPGGMTNCTNVVRPVLPITVPQIHAHQSPTSSQNNSPKISNQQAINHTRTSVQMAHPSAQPQERPTATVSPIRTHSSPSRLPASPNRPQSTVSPQHMSQQHSSVQTSVAAHCPRPIIPLTSTAAAITPPNVTATSIYAETNGPVNCTPTSSPTNNGCKTEDRKTEKREKKGGLLKLLAGASAKKKSRSPPSISPTHDPQAMVEGVIQGAVGLELSMINHGRAGSCPIESEMQGAMGMHPLHRKTGSLDLNFSIPSPVRQPTCAMVAVRPEPKSLSRERYRVVVPYPPQSEAEIELKEGDIVFVHKKREDGWYKGTLQRNGRTGLFPGSFVESF
ncbi:E3 ubiquitin-protein ligase SH3RF3 isoform X3 [Hyla sarda]|uniref:E3 ubiquitin-protein ligase SH3RF3 isoform X3 n=1 Tax=Hyla sarda TaxID=327740 RepID=UPI0024C378BB|nr:E3 ubiquitin-protein ligase SH3RF3 isoform X3 [Hyla sarda]